MHAPKSDTDFKWTHLEINKHLHYLMTRDDAGCFLLDIKALIKIYQWTNPWWCCMLYLQTTGCSSASKLEPPTRRQWTPRRESEQRSREQRRSRSLPYYFLTWDNIPPNLSSFDDFYFNSCLPKLSQLSVEDFFYSKKQDTNPTYQTRFLGKVKVTEKQNI